MTRSELREQCFKMLFGAEFYPAEEKEEQMKQYFLAPEEEDSALDGTSEILHRVEVKETDEEKILKRVESIMNKIPDLDEQINQVAEGWKTRRMGRVELAILRLAVYEMKYDDQIPDKVAINEAVELAKKFGGSDAPAFVNGILAKLV